jgi:hypothetical protein
MYCDLCPFCLLSVLYTLLLLLWYHSLFQALTAFTVPRYPAGIASGFLTFCFFRGGVVSPTPNLEDRSLNLYPPKTGWPSYTPGHWVACVSQDCHFPYPLTWPLSGLYTLTDLSSGGKIKFTDLQK